MFIDGGVLLGRNGRDEWELLGGRPEFGEDHAVALRREIDEEAGLSVDVVGEALSDVVFEPIPDRFVRIVTYACRALDGVELTPSDEHLELRVFAIDDALDLPDLPADYKQSIRAAAR